MAGITVPKVVAYAVVGAPSDVVRVNKVIAYAIVRGSGSSTGNWRATVRSRYGPGV